MKFTMKLFISLVSIHVSKLIYSSLYHFRLSPTISGRRSSGDSDASYHTTASFVALAREAYPHQSLLDTEKLLEDVHRYNQQMVRRSVEKKEDPPSKDLVRGKFAVGVKPSKGVQLYAIFIVHSLSQIKFNFMFRCTCTSILTFVV